VDNRRPELTKRKKELARLDKQKQKLERRAQRDRERKARDPNAPEDEDPDIAGIIPGPQPPLIEE
jgi:hypothetical protein